MKNDALILILNCGSSSIKFSLIDATTKEVCADGLAEAIGSEHATLTYQIDHDEKQRQTISDKKFSDIVQHILSIIRNSQLQDKIIAVGHRVVHGGENFTQSQLITPQVIEQISDCIPLAPQHNPANLTAIEQAQEVWSELPHIAVFDTAFHQTMPTHAYLYGLPHTLYRQYKIRRYGFHGINHQFVSLQAEMLLKKPTSQLNIITAHLGNGCSLAAVARGKSVDTTMGLTPLEGLVMGNRCGNIDPNIPGLLSSQYDFSPERVTRLLNHESGLLGISELSNDMRELLLATTEGHSQAQLAIDIFCYQLAKQIGALSIALPSLDALIFTGGIGENAAPIRQQVLTALKPLGLIIDSERNKTAGDHDLITAENSRVPAFIVKANEELMIARETLTLLEKK